MFPHKGAWSSKGLIIQINFRSALTLVDSAIADSSESDCELQTPADVRFWDQKLSYCYTSGLLLHNFLSVLCESVLFNEGFSTEISSLRHFMIEEPSVDLRTMYESQNFLRMEQLTGDQTITRFVDEIMYNQNITIKLCVDRKNIYRQNKRLIYEYSIWR